MSVPMHGKPRLLRFSLIRTRLTLWIVTIVVVGMLAFVLTTFVVANTLLQRQNEVRLQQTVLALSTALAQEPDANLSSVRRELDAVLRHSEPRSWRRARAQGFGGDGHDR